MRIDVEEFRAHKSMMAWGMVFGVVVSKVVDFGGPVNI